MRVIACIVMYMHITNVGSRVKIIMVIYNMYFMITKEQPLSLHRMLMDRYKLTLAVGLVIVVHQECKPVALYNLYYHQMALLWNSQIQQLPVGHQPSPAVQGELPHSFYHDTML